MGFSSGMWNRGIRAAALALAVAAALAGAPTRTAAAPIGWQATGGWYTDGSDFLLGVGARFALTTFTVVPNAEYVFADGGSIYTLNLDGTMNVLPLAAVTGYIGAGVGMLVVSPDGGDTSSDGIVNLIAGAGLNATRLHPFAQFKWVLKDDEDMQAIVFGVRF
jgi:hypothetical protein